MITTKQLPMIIVFFAVILSVFIILSYLTDNDTVDIDDTSQVSSIDFDEYIAILSTDCYERYPSRLYTPDDFASGRVAQTPSDEHATMEQGCGTYRIVLELTPGKVYGLSAYTATYAQKLWIDGVLVSQMGEPSDSAESYTPKTGHFTAYFTAGGTTEIVIWRASFDHARGGQVYPLYLGYQDKITAFSDGIIIRGILVAGSALTAAVFFLGIFLFFRERIYLLWFSLACLSITIYTLILDHKLIMLLFPNMSWLVSHRLEYITGAGMVGFFFAYVMLMFRQRVSHPINVAGLSILAVYLAVVMLTPPRVYTTVMPWLRTLGVIYCTCAILLLFLSMKSRANRKTENYLMLTGTFLYLVLTIIGIRLYGTGNYGDSPFFRGGLMLLIFANTLALSLSFTRTEDELYAVRQSEREAQETNKLLSSLGRVKSDFLANISHEMRTPLTVISSYAGLTLRQIRKNAVDAETMKNLDTVQREAVRLGQLVEQLKAVSLEKERQHSLEDTNARVQLDRAADFCGPICAKNNNRVTVSAPAGAIPLRVNSDSIFQTLVNLITNANRHTRGGDITLIAEAGDGAATLRIRDDGGGIPPNILPHVFERGVSGDGGSGLGLAISKEIIEEHGGKIEARSLVPHGTEIIITLPIGGSTHE